MKDINHSDRRLISYELLTGRQSRYGIDHFRLPSSIFLEMMLTLR